MNHKKKKHTKTETNYRPRVVAPFIITYPADSRVPEAGRTETDV